MESSDRSASLASRLTLALPDAAGAPSAGAALALACHVVMVDAGFRIRDGSMKSKLGRRSPYQPGCAWQQESGYEWRFVYGRQGKALPITLTVSLHGSSGRVLTHAVEGDPETPSHACVIGLQLDRYVNADQMISGKDWVQALSNEHALVTLMTDHIINPILSFHDTNISNRSLSDRVVQLMPSMLSWSPWLVGGTAVVAILAATAATFALRRRQAA